ncbi:hypothetical protein IEQ34_001894 [Dendrobium chrysotoxum]|uniref:Uncharacterized protein n=1 Tax=Dendrobium chrysotoxum TaxID=161865 RepID=A0AAV7HLD6_DENCH|nr:hypothetical protein IEQ34_001894 [Dendrobium chrysotoxum]
MRQFGQTKLPSSFISRSSFVNQDPQAKLSKKPISLSEFLNRKLGKSSGRLLQEKQVSIGSLGSDKKELGGKKKEDGNSLMPNGAIFQQFSRALKGQDNFDLGDEAENEQVHSRKRKRPTEPTEFSSGDVASHQNCLLVLGDDPKPKPRPRSEQKLTYKSSKTIYNHYASGQGWWDGDKEGIDNEEVGHNEIWEGLGSTTLGGLEWN